MTLHIVVGPPCSGKSSFVEANAPEGAPRFDFDKIAATVGGIEFNHDRPGPVTDVVMAMRRGLYGWVLDPSTEVTELWLIEASPTATTVERFEAMGAKFHLLDPGEEECIARAVRDGRPEGTVERIRAWYSAPPTIPGHEVQKPKKEGPVRLKNVSADVAVKSPDGDDAPEGRFEAYASVFDVVDSYGEIIRKGAFADTLQEWAAAGKTIPVLYGHDFRDPFMNLGGVVEAVEDDHGLRIVADLDMDNPTAVQVRRLIQAGRVSEMSFAFTYRDAGPIRVGDDEFIEVRDVELFEVSIVPVGANRETEIMSVRSALDVLTAVRQANLDPRTEAALTGGAGPADDPAGDDRAADPGPPASSEVSDEDPANSPDALALRARLSIIERMNFDA